MDIRARFLGLVAGLLLGANACAEQWFSVISPDADPGGPLVEVELDTISTQDHEGVIRLTHAVLQSHPAGFGYRSVVANAQFDCQRRTITLTSAAYYALAGGKGQRLGAEIAAQHAGVPPGIIQGIPPAAQRALLRATCSSAPPN